MSSDAMNSKKPEDEQKQKKSDQQWMWALGIGLAVVFVILLIFLVSAGAGGYFGHGSEYSSYYGPRSTFFGTHDHAEFFGSDLSDLGWCDVTNSPTSLSALSGSGYHNDMMF